LPGQVALTDPEDTMAPRFFRATMTVLGIATVAWLASVASQRGPVRAAEPAAALRHQFMNNLDARRQVPDARGYLSVTFKTPLPTPPTILLQCANPRYTAKVHGASPTGFLFAIYRTRDVLQVERNDPFNGDGAAKPVTDFRDTDNIDVAWVALAD
jgi:hypothetical protein